MRYDYSVVRFVPDTFKAEFVNVGLIVGNPDTGEWQVRRVSNAERATRFRNGAPLSAVWSYLDGVEELLAQAADDDQVLGPDWLAEQHQRLQNLVQLSPPMRVLADDVDAAMTRLWDEMVVDPERAPRASAGPTRAALLQAYLLADISDRYIHQNATAHVGRQDVRVDFAIGNGRLAQIAHAFSFGGQTPGVTVRNLKAWSWTIRDVRDKHGSIHVTGGDGEPYDVDAGVPIDVVHDEPDTDEGRRALDEAFDVLDELNVTPHGASDLEFVARNAVERLTHVDGTAPAEKEAL